MRYKLTDGTTITPEELVELVPGIKLRNARCRLGRTDDRAKLLKPVRTVKNGGRAVKKYTLSNGKEYTIKELMEITGCGYPTMVSRLYASSDKDAERIMKPSTLSMKEQDRAKVEQLAASRMIGDPDGFWKLFNKVV